MFEAIAGNHTGYVKILLSRGELRSNTTNTEQYGRTALMVAVRLGRLEITQELLIFLDIDINIQDVNGHTALSIATAHGYGQVVQSAGIGRHRSRPHDSCCWILCVDLGMFSEKHQRFFDDPVIARSRC